MPARAFRAFHGITFVVCRSHGDKLTSLMEINVASHPRYYATARRACVKVGRVENGGGGEGESGWGERERERGKHGAGLRGNSLLTL